MIQNCSNLSKFAPNLLRICSEFALKSKMLITCSEDESCFCFSACSVGSIYGDAIREVGTLTFQYSSFSRILKISSQKSLPSLKSKENPHLKLTSCRLSGSHARRKTSCDHLCIGSWFRTSEMLQNAASKFESKFALGILLSFLLCSNSR